MLPKFYRVPQATCCCHLPLLLNNSVAMFMLPMLQTLLSQVLVPPHLHTAVLFTPAGELVSFAVEPSRSKDEIKILVGVTSEVWQETREQGYGMVESDVSVCCPQVLESISSYCVNIARSNHRSPSGRGQYEWRAIFLRGTSAILTSCAECDGCS
jgi:hypothetical protein